MRPPLLRAAISFQGRNVGGQIVHIGLAQTCGHCLHGGVIAGARFECTQLLRDKGGITTGQLRILERLVAGTGRTMAAGADNGLGLAGRRIAGSGPVNNAARQAPSAILEDKFATNVNGFRGSAICRQNKCIAVSSIMTWISREVVSGGQCTR